MSIELLQEFFKWCTIINFGLLMFSFILCATAKSFIQRIHGKVFGLSSDTISAFLYGFIGFYKIVFFAFFVVPWIALTIMSKA